MILRPAPVIEQFSGGTQLVWTAIVLELVLRSRKRLFLTTAPRRDQRQLAKNANPPHPRGEAQVDFGVAQVDLVGERTQVALFVMTLPYSDAVFVQAFPRECTEAFQEGHRRSFEFFGSVPTRISYDNSRVAIAKITGSRERGSTSSSEQKFGRTRQ